MQVETTIGLMRMAEDGNRIIANLARTILGLVDGVHELEARAGLAEAALEAERAKVAQLQTAIRQLGGDAGTVPALA